MAIIARLVVSIDNVTQQENFGQSYNISDCDMVDFVCYDSTTSSKVWGQVSVVVYFSEIVEMVKVLVNEGYHYVLYKKNDATGAVTYLATSIHKVDEQKFEVPIYLHNQVWYLTAEPANGWYNSYTEYLYASNVILALIISVLTFIVMIHSEHHAILLEAILPSKVIKALKRGDRFSESFDHVTILFSDIVEFTSISSIYPAWQVAELLDELFTVFDKLAEDNNVYKIETVGDAFVCTSGCPEIEDTERSAQNISKMAVDMIDACSNFVSSSGIKIQIRVGIHSGPIVASVIGTKMPRYCLIGKSYNH